MLKIKLIWSFILLGAIFGFGFASAQTPKPAEEAISKFSVNITVHTDNSIDVSEIIYYTPGVVAPRHGIYRDIYTYSSQHRKMNIDNIRVTDLNDKPYPFLVEQHGDYLRLKIGDPNVTFTTEKIYQIYYRATNAVGQLRDVDEIYWNATGDQWNIPIYYSETSIIIPPQAQLLQSACYVGPAESTTSCQEAFSWPVSTFVYNNILQPGEGLTVAVGFSKGVVAPYSKADNISSFFDTYMPWIIGGILPILTLIFSLLYWYKKGRDPKGTGVIVPQYDVPDGLTPMEVAGIATEKVNSSHISAEIIYLATRGYIKITQLEERFIGLFKSTDYEISLVKDTYDIQNDFDKKLLFYLFNTEPSYMANFASIFKKKDARKTEDTASGIASVKLSELKYVFYSNVPDILKGVLDALLNKGYYKNLGRMKNSANRIVLFIFLSVWASLFFGGTIGVAVLHGNPLPVMAGIFISVIIYGIISHFSPAKTEKGIATKEYLLGLRDYLRIAEKDRLEFHNAPDKKPEVFEKLLPYAMVLGVADIWAKEFEGIYTTVPSWYSGGTGNAFSAIAFSHTISNFSSFISSSLASAPGGSGGGGSSGGGGGGGGGGGW